MSVSLRQIEYFLVLSERLNFRRAAEACSVTQPALSSQIQLLEENLGLQLFERDRRSVALTSHGHRMVERAREILTGVNDMQAEALALQKPFTGELRIGVIPTVAPYVLPSVVPALRRAYPDLRLKFREDRTERILERLWSMDLDLLLLALEVDLGDLCTLPLYVDPFVLAAPPDHPLRSRKVIRNRDLGSCDVLLLEDGHCLREQALKICQLSQARELPDFRASSLSTLVSMVSAGNGVTLLPTMAVSREVHRGTDAATLSLAKPVPSRTVGFAWRQQSARAGEFHEIARHFRENAPDGVSPAPA